MLNMVEQRLDQVAELCRRVGARRLEIFGSAVRKDFEPATSELDFLVECDDLPPASYADAYFTLKESLEALFRRPIDLITDASLENPYFRARVETERQTIYAR